MQRRIVHNEEGWLLSYADLITNLLVFFAMLLGASEISRTRMQQIVSDLSGEEAPASLASIQEEIDARIEEEGLQEMVRTDLTDDGLKLSLNSGFMFDSGSTVVRPDQEGVLRDMLETLVPYAERYDFAVEGHTDSTPFGTPDGRTNWDLSTDRANAVRRRLSVVGIAEDRIRVEGYADTVSLPEEELAGLPEQERLARHRRVIVKIY
jgi:chemotaxis protein MotB